MIYREIFNKGRAALQENNIDSPDVDAKILLEFVCKTDRNTLFAHPDMEVSEEEWRQYTELIQKRCMRIPLQHLTGSQNFMGIDFIVDKNVLVPRQDTECLVEEALTYVEDGMRVLDMCTGSGCILLSLMNYRHIEGVGCDKSAEALEVAKRNADLLELEPVLLQGDMFDTLSDNKEYEKHFDVIVSNPPYIRTSVISTLSEEVKDHDPLMALDGGEDGLDFYRIIARESCRYLTNYGRIFLEIGYDQKEDIIRILTQEGFSDVKVIDDYAGNPRVAVAKYIMNLDN